MYVEGISGKMLLDSTNILNTKYYFEFTESMGFQLAFDFYETHRVFLSTTFGKFKIWRQELCKEDKKNKNKPIKCEKTFNAW